MRWVAYLLAGLLGEASCLILAPLLVLTAVNVDGPIDNNNGRAVEPRLPRWLSWMMTPDNSLLGDKGHKARHVNSSRWWQMTCWLARNRFYGGKWTLLAAPMTPDRTIDGNPKINRNNGCYGTLRIKMGPYWQWKYVQPIGKTGFCWMLNMGWMLDDAGQEKALFLFSPRIVKITG